MANTKEPISIWYFVGLLLTVYGVLILGAGLYDLVAGVKRDTVLAELHAGIWWGALLLVLGVVYVYFFSPAQAEAPVENRGRNTMAKKMTFGLIVGNRGFFPDHLAKSGREEMIAVLNAAGYDVVCPDSGRDQVRRRGDPRRRPKQCAELFRAAAATRSTASSSRCRISAKSEAWSRPCAWPT